MIVGKLVGQVAAVAAVLGWLATAGVADAAKKHKAGGVVSGVVVRGANGKAVRHAHVRVAAAGHHHKHHKHVKKAGAKLKKKHGKAHVGHHKSAHAAAMSGSHGKFTVHGVGSGAVTLVAHKRGVGTGRVRVTAGSSNVRISLHKRQHAHSGLITAHVRHAVEHSKAAHKKGAKGNVKPEGGKALKHSAQPQSVKPQ